MPTAQSSTKGGKGKKLRRTMRKKGKYNAYRLKYEFKKIRRRAAREKRIKAARLLPRKESPSDKRRRLLRVGKPRKTSP